MICVGSMNRYVERVCFVVSLYSAYYDTCCDSLSFKGLKYERANVKLIHDSGMKALELLKIEGKLDEDYSR